MNTAILALIGTISAVQLNREPLLSANASELEVHQRPAYSLYPVDYVVPDFGVSHEIMYTENNIKMAEQSLSHTLMADWKADKSTVDTPRDYVVPNFGLDEDISSSLQNLEAEEKIHGAWNIDLEWKGTDFKSTGVTNADEEIKKANEGPYYKDSATATDADDKADTADIIKKANVVAGADDAKVGGGMMGGMIKNKNEITGATGAKIGGGMMGM